MCYTAVWLTLSLFCPYSAARAYCPYSAPIPLLEFTVPTLFLFFCLSLLSLLCPYSSYSVPTLLLEFIVPTLSLFIYGNGTEYAFHTNINFIKNRLELKLHLTNGFCQICRPKTSFSNLVGCQTGKGHLKTKKHRLDWEDTIKDERAYWLSFKDGRNYSRSKTLGNAFCTAWKAPIFTRAPFSCYTFCGIHVSDFPILLYTCFWIPWSTFCCIPLVWFSILLYTFVWFSNNANT